MIIHTFNVPGNYYDATKYCNECSLAEYVIQFDCVGYNTLVVLKLPKNVADNLKAKKVI